MLIRLGLYLKAIVTIFNNGVTLLLIVYLFLLPRKMICFYFVAFKISGEKLSSRIKLWSCFDETQHLFGHRIPEKNHRIDKIKSIRKALVSVNIVKLSCWIIPPMDVYV